MGSQLRVTGVRLYPGGWRDLAAGLLGWLRVELEGALVIDGIALRRQLDGRVSLSFPMRRDRNGTEHAIVRPLNAEARRGIEEQVLAQLGDLVGEGTA